MRCAVVFAKTIQACFACARPPWPRPASVPSNPVLASAKSSTLPTTSRSPTGRPSSSNSSGGLHMESVRLFKIAVGALLPVVAACSDDNAPATPATSFTATLSGANEVPAVTTPATGTTTLTVSGSVIQYTVNVTELQNAVVAHIHIAPTGQNGPVRLNLC